jgi:hypothetical protein
MTAARQVAEGAWAANAAATYPRAGLTSAGTTQANALPLVHEYVEVATVAAGSGVRLPTSVEIGGLTPGDPVVVANLGANALLVYPPVGGKIGTAAVNAALSVPAGKVATFYSSIASALNWTANLSA